MKRRRRTRNNHISGKTLKWCILAVLCISMLGIGYAANTNVLTGSFLVNTGSMSFLFDSNEDIEITIQKGPEGEIEELDGKAAYDEKSLTITDIGPLNINDFTSGNAIITIRYAIKSGDQDKGIKQPAEVKEEDARYDLGKVDFELVSHTPVWLLENGDMSLGSKTKDIGTSPKIIYKLLPDNLGQFHAYNQLLPHMENGIMCGTLLLKQESAPEISDPAEIGLSSLNLPDEVCDQIQNGESDTNLKITGKYCFSIPLDLDQFNTEE